MSPLRGLGAATVAVALFAVGTGAAPAAPPPAAAPDFGPNVYVFDPSMPTSQIQSTIDAIATQQVDNEFGTQRYTLLFKPGTYGSTTNPLTFQVGYYTEVAGLGGTDRRHDQRPRRRLQPLPGAGQLHRARQLLALPVEPDDQRDGPIRLSLLG